MMGSYLDHYKNLFCPPQKYEDYICDDPNWAYNHFSWDYWGPHNCIGSCAEPGFDCDACSNKKYFHCKRKNESVCLHPDLKCDGHQHCDDGSDENNVADTPKDDTLSEDTNLDIQSQLLLNI